MRSVNAKLKLAFFENPPEGPLLVVRRKNNDERLELPLTPANARLLLKQLTIVLDEALSKQERL